MRQTDCFGDSGGAQPTGPTAAEPWTCHLCVEGVEHELCCFVRMSEEEADELYAPDPAPS